jgi:hypothetical protein
MVSDADQTNICDNDFECTNSAQVLLSVLTTGNGDITGTGEQKVDQYNDCYDRADCSNDALIQAGLGFDSAGNPLAVNGQSKIYTEFSQVADKTNLCSDRSSFANEVDMEYFATALDGANVRSISDQHIIQINECSGIQICFNDGEISNHVFARDVAGGVITSLDGTSSQTLTQICDGSADTCLNTNNLRISTQALSNAMLTYDASQTFTNTNQDNQGNANILIGQTGGAPQTFNVAQTGNLPQTDTRGNTPPT